MRGWFPILAALALLSACRSSTAPVAPVPVELTSAPTHTQGRDEITAAGGSREVVVRGFLWTGGGGYTLRARAVRTTGRRYVLAITARQTSPGVAVPIHHSYVARLRGLPPGSHPLQVVHRVEGRTERVLEQVVTVEP